jgi:acyl dehydratase
MPLSPSLYFEDFVPGEIAVYGAYHVTRDAIITFAAEFDPQPFHLDEAAAEATLLGGLAASGWHTCAMVMRMNCDGLLLDSASLGAPGIDEVKWLKPVRPDDVLRVRCKTLGARASRSRPDMGLVEFQFDALNQRDEIVMAQRNVAMFARRGADPSGGAGAGTAAPDRPAETPAVPELEGLPMFDDLPVGASSRLGTYTFTRDAVLRFARAYDPQSFHVDEEAARSGPFGRLAASGWHTCAAWMRTYLDWFAARAETVAAKGLPVPAIGPSPGFRDLKWLRPVHPGDTITYSMTMVDKRASASRPQWGLLTTRNRGVDQHGTAVFEFTVASFWERRPAGAALSGA